jgi:hypothetical protein
MVDSMGDRRTKQRCVKDVGMGCALLNGNVERPVTIRNFSDSGLFFETAVKMMPGTYIVLRSIGANDAMDTTTGTAGPQYALDDDDPDVCSLFRSHTVAKVQRCERFSEHSDSPRYGVAAEILRWTY